MKQVATDSDSTSGFCLEARVSQWPLHAMPESCAICFESLATPGWGCQTLECEHVFHERCVVELRRNGATGRCPLCRSTSSDLMTVQEMLDAARLNINIYILAKKYFSTKLFAISDKTNELWTQRLSSLTSKIGSGH